MIFGLGNNLGLDNNFLSWLSFFNLVSHNLSLFLFAFWFFLLVFFLGLFAKGFNNFCFPFNCIVPSPLGS